MAIAEINEFTLIQGNSWNGRVSFHSTTSCYAVTYLPYAAGINKKFSLQQHLKPLNTTQNFFSTNHLHLICVY